MTVTCLYVTDRLLMKTHCLYRLDDDDDDDDDDDVESASEWLPFTITFCQKHPYKHTQLCRGGKFEPLPPAVHL